MRKLILSILFCTVAYGQVGTPVPLPVSSDPTSQVCHVSSGTPLKQFGGVVYSCQGAMNATGAYAVLPGGSGGTITAVNPGTGLSGGGSSGDVSLAVDPAIVTGSQSGATALQPPSAGTNVLLTGTAGSQSTGVASTNGSGSVILQTSPNLLGTPTINGLNIAVAPAATPVVKSTGSGLVAAVPGTGNDYISPTLTTSQHIVSPITTIEPNIVFDVHGYAVQYPSGCTLGFGSAPTPLECAVLAANNWASTNAGVASVQLKGEVYNPQNAISLFVSSNSMVTLDGVGSSQSIINLTGASGQVAAVTQSGSSTARGRIHGVRINANSLSSYGLLLNNVQYTQLDDVIVTGATVANYKIAGGNTVTGYDLRSFPFGHSLGVGSYFIATMSGGAISSVAAASQLSSVVVGSGGSGYTAPAPTWTGNCQVVPQVAFLTSGTSPNLVITSVVVQGAGLCEAGASLTATDATGTGATFTPSFAATGGANYTPSQTQVLFLGSGNLSATGGKDAPCPIGSMPTGTLSFSSGSYPASVTGLTITSPGTSCGKVFIQIVDRPALTYDFDIAATDSRFYTTYAAAGNCGYHITTDENKFFGTHILNTPVGICGTSGGTEWYSTEFDSVLVHFAEISLPQKFIGITQSWDRAYPGASGFDIVSVSGRGLQAPFASCSNMQQGGGFVGYIDPVNGPVEATNMLFTADLKHFQDCAPPGQSAAQIPTQDAVFSRTVFNNAATFNNLAVATSGNNFGSQSLLFAMSVFSGGVDHRYQFPTILTPQLSGTLGALTTTFPATDSIVTGGYERRFDNSTTGTISTTNCTPGLRLGANAFSGSSLYDSWVLQGCLQAGTNADAWFQLLHGGSTGTLHLLLPTATKINFGASIGTQDTTWFRCAAARVCVGNGTGTDTTGGFRGRIFEFVSGSGSGFLSTWNGNYTAARAVSIPDISGTVVIGTPATGNCAQWTGSGMGDSGAPCQSAPSFSGSGTATFAPQLGAGTGATAICTASHVCDSVSGAVLLTSGTLPAIGSDLIITLPITRTNIPNCTVNIEGGITFLGLTHTTTTTTITINTGVALAASTAYTIDYICGGN